MRSRRNKYQLADLGAYLPRYRPLRRTSIHRFSEWEFRFLLFCWWTGICQQSHRIQRMSLWRNSANSRLFTVSDMSRRHVPEMNLTEMRIDRIHILSDWSLKSVNDWHWSYISLRLHLWPWPLPSLLCLIGSMGITLKLYSDWYSPPYFGSCHWFCFELLLSVVFLYGVYPISSPCYKNLEDILHPLHCRPPRIHILQRWPR